MSDKRKSRHRAVTTLSKDASPGSGKPKLVDLPVTYKLSVKAVSASNLPAADTNGLSDPYVVLQLAGSKVKVQSRVIDDTLNPIWNEVELDGYFIGSDSLTITVMDHDRTRPGHRQRTDDYLGVADVLVRTLLLGVAARLRAGEMR
jgi:Ca2+-dependent lipid-binding protein